MAIEDDVLVVGGGVAGMTAALAAAEAGASVRLVTKSQSTLRHASGLVDVLGYADGDLLADPFAALDDLPADHPYAKVGVEAVRDGLARFDAVTGERYRGGHTDRNALLPTHGGAVKPTARYPASAAAGLASDERDALLVGFETLSDFDAPLAADHLRAADVPFDVRGATVSFPGTPRADAKVTRYAHALDGNDDEERERLAARVARVHDGEPRVGFPAVLGEAHPGDVRATLADALDADVFEVPMGPPSLPGIRLEADYERALREAGVNVVRRPVVDYEADGEHLTAAVVERNGQHVPHHAESFVLATGGLVGEGIDSDRGGVREPVFDCHVPHPADRYDWFVDERFGEQPYPRFGVVVDDDLRPRDAEGRIEFENLRAAGSVVGGADFAAECSGMGVSLATGDAAGSAAGADTQ
ncbi:glycerol-3-phosphate dehydrogenase subunit B [Halarchaeum rubridurum]|uniref:Glycerol-3-phosphate dehydrogenase subunit B n=1 Tax=Halarchaeum rubridurum TaxID=489911 RepID=A0A830FZ34_9EURY|nr:glycerol-3-phosphate dehydrogenase subunit GlpB [Halarchaeum rubridurum]MBP1953354.1 glycerol-3-phosphate dehydrogenase subunit B [Halarchaeum rubridurum]GGM65938.1 glycerol-3-phosphate dehydrogenase subunit B [Halarchaeum rubridurum]